MYLKYALTVILKVFLEIYSNLRANTSREKKYMNMCSHLDIIKTFRFLDNPWLFVFVFNYNDNNS